MTLLDDGQVLEAGAPVRSPVPGAGPDADAASGPVRTVHASVPGRMRLHVAGLHQSPELQAILERGMAAMPGVFAANASAATGNLLVQFDTAIPRHAITQRVAALARGDAMPPDDQAEGVGKAAHWHARGVDDIAGELGASTACGLTATEARARLAVVGANALPPPPVRSALAMLAGQFNSLPVGLLAVAAGISIVTGGAVEAVAILGVLALNGTLGFAIERRSERTIKGLGSSSPAPMVVIRDGTTQEVAPEAVVPGDFLVLGPGDVVPADARLVSASDLTVGEAMLTGESLPVTKHADTLARRIVPLGDRANMVYRGTAVTGGSGTALVVATGGRTEVGRIQALVSQAEAPQTPMERQLDGLGRQLFWASLGICGAVMGIGALRGFALYQVFRSAISLAVAAIPEGLPTVATTTLALGIEDMRKRKVLVRRLDAVETLASVGVVCFDKTGTLTLNRMSVARVALAGGPLRAGPHGLLDGAGQPSVLADSPDLDRLLRVAVLCSEVGIEDGPDGPALTGSATEAALVQVALDAGLDAVGVRRTRPRVAIRHRTETYRFMATSHTLPDDGTGPAQARVAVKGSPSEVLDLCGTELRNGVAQPLTDPRRAEILRENDGMADNALRVLGFAFRDVAAEEVSEATIPVHDLTWVGLAGLADPVRPGIDALIRTLHGAGIHTVMMTGDQVPTARAVARQLAWPRTAT